jgi:thiamine-monophosphate kinase
VELIGGDTTRGPLNLCVTIFGEVPARAALRRDAGQAGDDIWVSGTLGEAALGLAHKQDRTRLPGSLAAACLARLHDPEPRVALGLALRGVAHAAIDVSDGLLADLGHILEASRLGADVRLNALPRNVAVDLDDPLVRRSVLAGGDDYELVFTAPQDQRQNVIQAAAGSGVAVTRIGNLSAGAGLIVRDAMGQPITLGEKGFDHFG